MIGLVNPLPSPRRVLVFLLSGLGDTLMFTPALRFMRCAWPEAHITAVAMRTSEHDVLAVNRDLDEVRMFPFLQAGMLRGLSFVQKLRSENFDLCILPCPANRIHYNVMGFLSGAPSRAGFRYVRQSRWNADFLNTHLLPHTDHVHNAEHNLLLMESLTGKKRDHLPGWGKDLALHLPDEDMARADGWMREKQVGEGLRVGLHISSSRAKRMDRKCWPREKFLEWMKSWKARHPGSEFILFCGDEDAPESEWLVREYGPGIHMARELPVRQVAGLIRRCHLMLSNDSGIMHVANAVGTPLVAIFGPTNPGRSGPWMPRAEVVRTGIDCSPCFYHTSRDLTCPAQRDYACLKELSVDRVMAAAESIIKK